MEDNIFVVTVNKDGVPTTNYYSEEDYNTKVMPDLEANYKPGDYSVYGLRSTTADNVSDDGTYLITVGAGSNQQSKPYTGKELREGKLALMQSKFSDLRIQEVDGAVTYENGELKAKPWQEQYSEQAGAIGKRVGKATQSFTTKTDALKDKTFADIHSEGTDALENYTRSMMADVYDDMYKKVVDGYDEDGTELSHYEERTDAEKEERRVMKQAEADNQAALAEYQSQLAETNKFIKDYEWHQKMVRGEHGPGPHQQFLMVNAAKYQDALQQRKDLEGYIKNNAVYKRDENRLAKYADDLLEEAYPHIFLDQDYKESLEAGVMPDITYSKGDKASTEERKNAKIGDNLYWDGVNRLAQHARMTLNAPDDTQNGFMAFLKGHGDTFSTEDFWTMGLTTIADNISVKHLFDKIRGMAKSYSDQDLADAIEAGLFDEKLSDAEKALLKAFVIASEADELRAESTANMYNAGKTSAESIGFMVQFILSGAVVDSGVSVASKALEKWLAKSTGKAATLALKTSIKNAVKGAKTLLDPKLIKAEGVGAKKVAASLALRGAEAVVTPIARTIPMTLLQTGLYKDYTTKLTERDEKGNLKYNYDTAILPAIRDASVEVWSEQSLDPVMNVFGAALGKAFSGIVAKSGRRGAILKTKIDDILDWLHNEEAMSLMVKGGWDGLIPEMGEELVGAAVKSIWDPKEMAGFWDKDNLITMAVAFAPMSILGGGMSMVDHAKRSKRFEEVKPRMRELLQPLVENGTFTAEKIEELFDRKSQTLGDIAENINELVQPLVENGEMTEDIFMTLLEFADSKAKKEISDVLQDRFKQEQRLRVRDLIEQSVGNKSFISADKNGNETVNTYKDKDGNTRYVIIDNENENMCLSFDVNGNNVDFVNPKDIKITRQDADAFCDEWAENQRKQKESERMQQEKAEQKNEVMSALQNGQTISLTNSETGEKEDYIFMGWNGDQLMVGKDANHIEARSIDEVANALGIDKQVLTDAQKQNVQIEQSEANDKKASEANEYKGARYDVKGKTGTLIRVQSKMDEEGNSSLVAWLGTPEGLVKTEVTPEELDEFIARRKELENGSRKDRRRDARLTAKEQRAYEAKVKAQFDAVKTKYTNADGSVRVDEWLAEDPETFAQYSDQKYNKDYTDKTLDANLVKQQAAVQAAQAAMDAETVPSKKDVLMQERDKALAKLEVLTNLVSQRNVDETMAGELDEEAAKAKIADLQSKGLNEQEIVELAAKAKAEAEQALASIQKPEVSTDIDAYMQEKKAYAEAVAAAQKKVAYWNSILATPMSSEAQLTENAKALQKWARNASAARMAQFKREMKEGLDAIAITPYEIVTLENVEEIAARDNIDAENMAKLHNMVEKFKRFNALTGSRSSIDGFHYNGKAYIFADGNATLEAAQRTLSHETQHNLNAMSGNTIIADVIAAFKGDRKALLQAVNTMSGSNYSFETTKGLADELIAFTMEGARLGENPVEKAMKAGMPQEFIDIIQKEYDRQTSNNLSQRSEIRDAHEGISGTTGSQLNGETLEGESGNEQLGSPRDGNGPVDEEGSLDFRISAKSEARPKEIEELFEGKEGVALQGSEVIAINEGNGIRFSVRTWEDGGREALATYLDKQIKKGKVNKDDASNLLAEMDRLTSMAKDLADGKPNGLFGQWAYELVRTKDGTSIPVLHALKKNNEYEFNIDFSTVCKKRQVIDHIFNKMIRDGYLLDESLSDSDIARMNQIIQKHGLEIACGICFVDSKRYNAYIFANGFLDKYNTIVASLVRGKNFGNWTEAVDSVAGYNYADNKEFSNEGKLDLSQITEVVDWENMFDANGNPVGLNNYMLDWSGVVKMFTAPRIDYKGNAKVSVYEEAMAEKAEKPEKPFAECIFSTLKASSDKMAFAISLYPSLRKLAKAEDFIASEGWTNILAQNEALAGLWTYQKGAAGARPNEGNTQYQSDGLERGINGDIFDIGGYRMQSFSDFIGRMYFDYLQAFADLASMGLPGHAYTKEPNFVKLFGYMGMKVNMSLVSDVDRRVVEQFGKDYAGLTIDANGNLTYNFYVTIRDAEGNILRQGQTFPPEEAFALQSDPRYSKTSGTIAVGLSRQHILMMLRDRNIRMVIPYHKSGLPHGVALIYSLEEVNDYTMAQNTRGKKTLSDSQKKTMKKRVNNYNFTLHQLSIAEDKLAAYNALRLLQVKGLSKEYGDASKVDIHETYNNLYNAIRNGEITEGLQQREFSERWDSMDFLPKVAADIYIEACESWNYIPKFDEFANEQGYYKTLIDFSVYDSEGNYTPQEAIHFEVPENFKELVKEALAEDESIVAKEAEETEPVIEEIEKYLQQTDLRAEQNRIASKSKPNANDKAIMQTNIYNIGDQRNFTEAEEGESVLNIVNGKPVLRGLAFRMSQEVDEQEEVRKAIAFVNGESELRFREISGKSNKNLESTKNSISLHSSYQDYITNEAKRKYAEDPYYSGWTHPELAYISAASHDGIIIPVEILSKEPLIQEAQKRVDASVESLHLTKSQIRDYALRLFDENHGSAVLKDGKINKVDGAEDFSGEVAQEKKAFIVIGRPAAGKSSVLVNPLSSEHKARLLDSDVVKPWLEGYDEGFGAGYVQEASTKVVEKAFHIATGLGENVIIPKIGGGDAIRKAIQLRKLGYSVSLYYNDIPTEGSIMRAASRFAQTGRYLSLGYLDSIKDKPGRNFNEFALISLSDAEQKLSRNESQLTDAVASRGGVSLAESRESGVRGIDGGYTGDSREIEEHEEIRLFDRAVWYDNNVPYGEKPRKVWDSEEGSPIPSNNLNFRMSGNEEAAEIYDMYENGTNGIMTMSDVVDMIDANDDLMQDGDLADMVDMYRTLQRQNLREGMRDFAGGEMQDLFDEQILPKLREIAGDALDEDNNLNFRISPAVQEEMDHIVATAKENGTYLKAPNGKDTKLNPEQWALVRTQNFKNWFGDWENEDVLEEQIMYLDKNGEPRIFTHNTNASFTKFEKTQQNDAGWLGEGFYFYGEADDYIRYGYGKNQMQVFIKTENPYFITDEEVDDLAEHDDKEYSREFTERLKDEGYDSVYYNGNLNYEVCVFDSNQIKSATDNNGEFSTSNNDIRFRFIGSIGARELDRLDNGNRMVDQQIAEGMEMMDKDAKTIKLATGWERGADGQWRYEMPDFRLKTRKAASFAEGETKTLADILNANDPIFKEYPQLADYKVTAENLGNYAGLTQFEDKSISLDYDSMDEYEDRKVMSIESYLTLLHEVQHTIQNIEGFATGTTSTIAKEDYDHTAGEVEARNVEDRVAMTPEQRRETLASETEDTPRDEQTLRFRITPEMDAEYMEAVNAGDMEKVSDLLAEAARAKGYISNDEYRMAHSAPSNDGYHKPLHNPVGMYPEDIYSSNGLRYYGYGEERLDREAWNVIRSVRNNPEADVKVYRAVPADVKESEVRTGDWVALSKGYADMHGKRTLDGDYRVIKQTVKAKNLFTEGNDLNEWGYDDGKQYAYKNAENNRKLMEPTYDDNGNLIPLSERFNEDKNDIRFRISDIRRKGIAEAMGEEKFRDYTMDVYGMLSMDLLDQVSNEAVANGGNITQAIVKVFANLAEKDELTQEEKDVVKAAADKLTTLAEAKTPYEINDILWFMYDEANKNNEGLANRIHNQEVKRNLGQKKTAVPGMSTIDFLMRAAGDKSDIQAQYEAMDALVEEMNTITAAMAERRTYDRATVGMITKLGQDVLESGLLDNMTAGEVKRLLGIVRRTTSMRNVQNEVNELYGLILGNHLRNVKNLFEKELKRKATKVNSKNVVEQSALDVDGQSIMSMLKDYKDDISSTPAPDGTVNYGVGAGLLAEMQKRLDIMSDTEATEEQKHKAETEYIGLSLAKQYIENVGISEKEEADIKNAMKEADRAYGNGQMEKKEHYELMKELHKALVECRSERAEGFAPFVQTVQDITAASHTLALDFARKNIERIQEIHHNANSDMQGIDPKVTIEPKGAFGRFYENIGKFTFLSLPTFDQMLRLFGRKSVNGEGYLWNRFMRGWVDAAGKEFIETQKEFEILDAKVSEVFRKKMRWSDLYRIEAGMPTRTAYFFNGGKDKEPFELTQGQLLYILLADQMTDGRMKLRKMGITEEDVESIRKDVDPRFLALADWVVNEYFPRTREKYNAVHERMFGAPMSKVSNYFPLKVNKHAIRQQKDVSQATIDPAAASTVTGSIMKRSVNVYPLDIMNADAFSMVIDHVQKMEHWAAFAEWNRDLSDLLSYNNFVNSVRNMGKTIYGSKDELMRMFEKVCRVTAGSYAPDKSDIDRAALAVGSGVTAAKISARIWTAFKQLSSFPAYLSEVTNPVYFAEGAVKGWSWAMENLPLFEKRWKSRQLGDHILKASQGDVSKLQETLSRYGMSPNAAVDAYTVSMGAYAMYKTKLKKYLDMGFSQEAADKKAKQDATILYNETQQSNEAAFLSPVQSDRGLTSTVLTIFRNSSMGYTRQEFDALRNLVRKLKPGYKNDSIAFMTKQLEREGLSATNAFRAAKATYQRQTAKDLIRLAIFGYGLPFLWNLLAVLPYLFFGDDDDKKKRLLEDVAKKSVFGPIEGLVAGNVISEAANMLFFEKKGFQNYDPTLFPLFSDIKNLMSKWNRDEVAAVNDVVNLAVQCFTGVNPQTFTDMAVAIIDACNGDLETAKEAEILFLRLVNAPQSAIDQLYIDELEMSALEAKNLTVPELAERYAKYKMRKGAGILSFLYDDANKKKIIDKYVKSLEDKTSTRIEEGWSTKQYLQLSDEAKEMETRIKELRTLAKSGDEEAEKELLKLFADPRTGTLFRFSEMNKEVSNEVNQAVEALTTEEMMLHFNNASLRREEIARQFEGDATTETYFLDKYSQYTKGVLPEMARVAKQYEEDFIANNPDYEKWKEDHKAELEKAEAEEQSYVEKIAKVDEKLKSLVMVLPNGKKKYLNPPERKRLNEQRKALQAERTAKKEYISKLKKEKGYTPEDYIPEEIYNSPEFQMYLEMKSMGTASSTGFKFKEIADLEKKLKEAEDAETRSKYRDLIQHKMVQLGQDMTRLVNGVDDDDDFYIPEDEE